MLPCYLLYMDQVQADSVSIQSRRDAWVIPGAIILAGLILGGATYLIRAKDLSLPPEGDVSLVRPVSETDHVIGNPGAAVVIIEYADIDSSYAKDFQATMSQLMAEYGAEGQVAWVYRHLPLIDQHPDARRHAEAAECVGSLGEASLFWRFIDSAHARAPGSQRLDPRDYDSIVEGLGIRAEAFNECLNANTFARRVMEDFENGLVAGAGGSPFSVVLIKGHPPITIDGAVPYDGMKRIVEESIEKAGS
jgi:protein-disulfide isomerase